MLQSNFERRLEEALGTPRGMAYTLWFDSKSGRPTNKHSESYVSLIAYPGGSYLQAVVDLEVDTALGQQPPVGWNPSEEKDVDQNGLQELIEKSGLHFDLNEFLHPRS